MNHERQYQYLHNKDNKIRNYQSFSIKVGEKMRNKNILVILKNFLKTFSVDFGHKI